MTWRWNENDSHPQKHRRPLRPAIALAVALFLGSILPARADPPARPQLRLEYRAARGCAEEKMLRYLVASKLGSDPFDASAPSHLTVTIRREGGRYVGTAELRPPAGPWQRSFPPMASCDDAIDALVFALAVHFGPGSPPPLPLPSPLPLPLPSPSPSPSPPSPLPDRPSHVLHLGLAAAIGLGVSPASAAPGVALDIGLRWLRRPPLSLSLEARAYPNATGPTESNRASVTTGLYTGALVPCAHLRVVPALHLTGCALIELGALRVTSDAPHPMPLTLLHAAIGLRGGIELPLIDHLALRATGDTSLHLRRYPVTTFGSLAWETPLVSAAFSLGPVVSFW